MKQSESVRQRRVVRCAGVGTVEGGAVDQAAAVEELRECVGRMAAGDGEQIERLEELIDEVEQTARGGRGIPPEAFFFVARLRYCKELKMRVFVFLNNVIRENPTLAEMFIADESTQFQAFLQMYEYPFFGWEYEIMKNLLSSKREVCDKIVAMGLLDSIQSCFVRVLSERNERYDEEEVANYFLAVFDVFIVVIRNSTRNDVLLERIMELCLKVINPEFLNDVFNGVFAKAVECISEIVILIPGVAKDCLVEYIQCFRLALEQREHRVLCSILNLVGLMVKPPKPFDFLREYSDVIFRNVNLYQEKEMLLLVKICCESLVSFPHSIQTICNNNILFLAFNSFEFAKVDFKCVSALLFSRLTNSIYWEYVSEFFIKNKIIIELGNILCLNFSLDLSKQIIHAFKNIIHAIKTSGNIEDNKELISQLFMVSSEQYCNEIFYTQNDEIINNFREMIEMLKDIGQSCYL